MLQKQFDEQASENVLRSGGDCFELLMISDGRQRTDQIPKYPFNRAAVVDGAGRQSSGLGSRSGGSYYSFIKEAEGQDKKLLLRTERL